MRFMVSGRGGGIWTVRLRPPKAGVVEGSEWKADLIIKITAEELINMLTGKFDARQAIADGNVELQGDLMVLRRIGFLFQAGGSATEVRADPAQHERQQHAIEKRVHERIEFLLQSERGHVLVPMAHP